MIVLYNYDICDTHVFICVSEWSAMKQIDLWKEPALFWIFIFFIWSWVLWRYSLQDCDVD